MWIWKKRTRQQKHIYSTVFLIEFPFLFKKNNSLWIWPEGIISSPSSGADSFPSTFHFHDTSSEKPALTSSPFLYSIVLFSLKYVTLLGIITFISLFIFGLFSLEHKMQVNGRALACLSSCLNPYSPAHKTPFISRWWVNEKNSCYIYKSIWLYSDFFTFIFHCASLSQKCWKCLPSLMRGVSKF